MDNQITNITLKHFKGIEGKTIHFSTCIPNQITLIVARNGAGKSTFCKAIAHLKNNTININEEDLFDKDIIKYPFSICFEGKYEKNNYKLEATNDKNEIKNKYHIDIIDSPVYAKDISRNIGGYNTGGARLATKDIEIIKLREKVDFNYSISNIRKNSDKPYAKCYNNLSILFSNIGFLTEYCRTYYDFHKQKRFMKLLDDTLNNFELGIRKNNTASEIKALFEEGNQFKSIRANSKYIEFYNFVKKYDSTKSESDVFFDIVQLLYEIKTEKSVLQKHIDYIRNRQLADTIAERIESLNTSGRKVVIKSKNCLLLRLPPVSKISNGERDLLTLAAKILSIPYRPLKTKQNIIVFDEIYDYLDGANLLEFQLLVSELIDYCKKNEYCYYFLLFTHLDPYYFYNFVLTKKIKVNYLDNNSRAISNKILDEMLINRECDEIRETISKYYFHYYPTTFNADNKIQAEFAKKFFEKYPTNSSFYSKLIDTVQKFIEKENIDVFEVCIALRIISEEEIYNLIKDSKSRNTFLEKHGPKKIEFAEEIIDIPNDISLLRHIFNEGAHINSENRDNKERMLYLKIDTLPLRKMIKGLYDRNKNIFVDDNES